jgi:hypothetical protein
MKYASITRDTSITFIIDGQSFKVDKDDKQFEEVKALHVALSDDDDIGGKTYNENLEKLVNFLNVSKGIINYTKGNVVIKDGVVTWDGRELHNALTKRMVRMMQEGFSINPLVKFMDNLMENPSKTAVEELYLFLDRNDLPITDDGHFVAYKKVRVDYTDIRSGTFDNSVGEKPTMARNEVDDQRHRTCSTGLHFCSKSYLEHFGSNGSGARVMILKLNPRDVVSIPSDYDNAKGRACTYEVIDEWNEWYEKYGKKAMLEYEAVYTKTSYVETTTDEAGVETSKTITTSVKGGDPVTRKKGKWYDADGNPTAKAKDWKEPKSEDKDKS